MPDLSRETIVSWLGAGCSEDCGAPLMRGFKTTARAYRRSNCVLPNDYDTCAEFRRQCLAISYIFDRWWENIEDLFTQAEIRSVVQDEDKYGDRLAKVTWDVYRS